MWKAKIWESRSDTDEFVDIDTSLTNDTFDTNSIMEGLLVPKDRQDMTRLLTINWLSNLKLPACLGTGRRCHDEARGFEGCWTLGHPGHQPALEPVGAVALLCSPVGLGLWWLCWSFESGVQWVQSLSVSCESIYSNEARCLEPLSLARRSSLPLTSIGPTQFICDGKPAKHWFCEIGHSITKLFSVDS